MSLGKLDKIQVIKKLVQLRFEIETCRNLSTNEIYLLADVCEAIGLTVTETDYVLGPNHIIFEHPIDVDGLGDYLFGQGGLP